MATQYTCTNPGRRQMVAAHETINAIDYLEVLDTAAPTGSPRQRTLLVRCFREVSALNEDNVVIEGGPANPPVEVVWARPASAATSDEEVPSEPITADEETFFLSLTEPDNVLVVRTDSNGDYSTYTLRLVTSPTNSAPPTGFDAQLSQVAFSFKAECPSDFDCGPITECPPEAPKPEPPIDYLAKDYASFRRLMLDRLSVIAPDWAERNPADLGIALVELLAYVGDHLSYFQDAVATEAYLGTARKRVSVRRHARLLDYDMHDGCNARAWVTIQIDPNSDADGQTLAGPSDEPGKERPGTLLITKTSTASAWLDETQVEKALSAGAQPFETLHDLVLRKAHNLIHFYTWGDDDCCLPKGATQATLEDAEEALTLQAGDVLIFEEVRGLESGLEADANPDHRHAVRLTKVEKTDDLLPDPPVAVVNIEWDPEDALPFALCLREVAGEPVSVARGNVVLADHGRTLLRDPYESDERLKFRLEDVPTSGRYRPLLEFGPLTQQGYVHPISGEDDPLPYDPKASAAHATRVEPRDAQPAIWLIEGGNPEINWTPERDLLNVDRFTRAFVVEVEEDGRAFLRFGGDDLPGRRPSAGVSLEAVYRVGNGSEGNVGAAAIAHLVSEPSVDLSGVVGVRNPLPAQGGTDPEPIEQVRLYAPQAFRIQERAVTPEDYAAVAERHTEVQRAAATRRWTGSWHTMFVTVDRKGGHPVDADFEAEMRAHLDRYRMAGHDLEIDGPRYVALEITLVVCALPGYFQSDVKQALLETFGSADLPDGRRGFFHPDNFTFGQPVYLSKVLKTAMEVAGVSWINLDDERTRFGRRGEATRTALDAGVITFERLEIARLDNDPNAPENGKFEVYVVGGL